MNFHLLQYCTCLAPVCFLSIVSIAQAQPIQADGTTSTLLNSNTPNLCMGNCTISGGDRRGGNLFHSFSEFNVNEGVRVLFLDPGVNNILSRVTGKSASNISLINGTLGVSGGNANLFLLNPNGIVFGQDASLDLGGSFVATTANSLQFGNQGFWETSVDNDSVSIPLLTVDPSALLYQSINGTIVNSSAAGLSVKGGQSLLLAGGDVNLTAGQLKAQGGYIGLGGLAEPGTINLSFENNALNLEFPDDSLRADVSITDGSGVDVRSGEDVSSNAGGEIAIHARNIYISENPEMSSALFAGITNIGGAVGGDIVLDAQNSIEITNEATVINSIAPGASGFGGNINITAKTLVLNSGARVSADVFGIGGGAGDILIEIDDLVALDGASITSAVFGEGMGGRLSITAGELQLENVAALNASTFGLGSSGGISLDTTHIALASDSLVLSSVEAGAQGDAGNIDINTTSLQIDSGAQIAASVLRERVFDDGLRVPPGIGSGGNITIQATDSVQISGFSEVTGFSSGLFASTEEGAAGPAGDIQVHTDFLQLENGATINAQTLNASEGGDINIYANRFQALAGGQIITSTESSGNAGNIKLEVDESITISGREPTFAQRQAAFPDRVENEADGRSGVFASARTSATGEAGSISIDPQLVLIQDEGLIAVSNDGTGRGGSIDLIAENLILDNASISAETASAQGGDIDLTIADLLFLSNDSEISATAGTEEGDGVGGNITIGASVIAASPTGNNDITANASDGPGGTILINAPGIFGFQALTREELLALSPDLDPNQLPSNDITAISLNSSDPNLSGQVILNTPETDPSDSTTELSENIDIPPKLAQSCRPGQALGNGQFANVGKGGLPSPPTSLRSYPAVWHDIRPPSPLPQASTGRQPQQIVSTTKTPPIIEAKGWVTTDQGLMLVAPNRPSSPSLIASGAC